MDLSSTELVLRKLIDAMERRCAGFPIGYELETLTIETAKIQLGKIQAELNEPANIQQQVPLDKAKLCTKIAGYTLCDAYSNGRCNFAGEPCRSTQCYVDASPCTRSSDYMAY